LGAIGIAVAAVLTTVLVTHPGQASKLNSSQQQGQTAGQSNQGNGGNGAAGGQGSAGKSGDAKPGSNGSGSNGGSNGSSAAQGSPGTSSTAIPTPGDTIGGTADVKLSDCAMGYDPGSTCHVYNHGRYYLQSTATATLLISVTIDGNVAASKTFVAPGGAHQYGFTMVFTIPEHAKKIVYQTFLKDATGKVLASTNPIETAGYG
jgi:hypothetical protein